MRPSSLPYAALAFLLAATAPVLASDGGLTELARIQTGLNRAAAGLPPTMGGTDPFERLVAAFAAGWASPGADPARAGPILAGVEAELARRQEALAGNNQQHQRRPGYSIPARGIDLDRYTARLRAAGTASPDPLVRFVAALHAAGAILIAENADLFSYDYGRRKNQSLSRNIRADGVWLRIPCRTLPGREEAFRRALAALRDLAGPVLDCPAAEGAETDLDALARFAHDPAAEAAAAARRPKPKTVPTPAPAATPSPPEGAWDKETAAAFMAANPDRAEAALRQADTPVGQLDYALFLFAFRSASPERDARIRALLAAVDTSKPGGDVGGVEEPGMFDGSAESMVRHLRWASSNGKAQTMPAFYAIPCAVLLQRPDLLDALEPQFGSNRDNFLPRSGCVWGRGTTPGFPETEVAAFTDATAAPTGYFLETYDGSMRYGFYAAQAAATEALRVNSRGLLANAPQVSPPPPYLVWSYLTLDNHKAQAATQAVFTQALDAMAAYFGSKGLDPAEARRAADAGLRRLALGQDCGGAGAPPPSFRTLLLDGAPAEQVAAFAAGGAWRDPAATAAFRLCAQSAGLDPLVHVATARPDVLPFLLDLAAREPDAAARSDLDLVLGVEARNAFGKTPLMAAAQVDQPDSVRLLLAHGADPNARTDATSTAWALRTPLMYAAAGGSLAAIRLLLDAGADPQAADSKGVKALHYLLGLGPVPTSPRLSPSDLAEAAQLLH